MQLSVLGSPAVLAGSRVVLVRGSTQVAVIAVLAAATGSWVRRAVLEDQVWGGSLVSESALRVTVNRLRSQLAQAGLADAIDGDRAAYRLTLPPGEIDAVVYGGLADAAAAARARGERRRAVELAAQAEALWRGPAYEGALEISAVRAEHERLERLRDDVFEHAAADLLDLGDPAPAAEAAGRVIDRQPFRESAWALHIAALHRLGRTAEAIAAYERLRRLLDAELGIGPGPSVRAVIDAVAGRGDLDTALVAVLPVGRPGAPAAAVAGPLRRPRGPFVGRDGELQLLLAGLADPTLGPWVIEGPAGIGKTRLAQEVTGTLLGDGWLVLHVGCSRGGGAGLEPVAELVDLLLGSVGPVARERYSALHALAPSRFEGDAPFAEPDGELRRVRIHDAATRLLADRADTRSVLVVIDDLHWIEPSGATALGYLLAAVPGVRWLFVSRLADRSDACAGLLADLARHGAQWSRLAPLTDAESATLVTALAGRDGEAWVDRIAARAGGDPLLVTELVRHLQAGERPEVVPAGIAAAVAAAVASCDRIAVDVALAVAIAGRRVSFGELAAVLGDPELLPACIDEAGRHGLVVPGDGAVDPPHDLVAQAVVEGCGPGQAAAWHRRWSAVCGAGGASDHHRLRHLLAAGDADSEELDAVAGPTLRRLLAQGAATGAAELANDYLAASGPIATSRSGIDSRLQAAAVLLNAGEVQRGQALYDLLWPTVHRLDDPVLLADAVLARGALDTATPHREREIEDTRRLLTTLPSDETARRVQVACWGAHHLSSGGDRAGAERMLRAAEAELERTPDLGLQGLLLGIQCQTAFVADATPAEARAAYGALHDFAELTGEVSAVTIARLFGLDQVLRDGTAADLEVAIEALAEIRVRFPRPDLRWWPVAARAAGLLSSGTVAEATAAIDEAEAIGNELRLSIAMSVGLSQRVFQRWAAGDLRDLAPLLVTVDPTGESTRLLGGALVALEAGDPHHAREVASVVSTRAPMLAAEGGGWAVAATLAGEIAFRLGHVSLGALVAAEVDVHRGTGLSMGGLTHGGAADRVVGQGLAACGEMGPAIEALEAGFELDRSRGWRRWARRAASAAAAVRLQRGAPGDVAAASALAGEADRLRTALADAV